EYCRNEKPPALGRSCLRDLLKWDRLCLFVSDFHFELTLLLCQAPFHRLQAQPLSVEWKLVEAEVGFDKTVFPEEKASGGSTIGNGTDEQKDIRGVVKLALHESKFVLLEPQHFSFAASIQPEYGQVCVWGLDHLFEAPDTFLIVSGGISTGEDTKVYDSRLTRRLQDPKQNASGVVSFGFCQ